MPYAETTVVSLGASLMRVGPFCSPKTPSAIMKSGGGPIARLNAPPPPPHKANPQTKLRAGRALAEFPSVLWFWNICLFNLCWRALGSLGRVPTFGKISGSAAQQDHPYKLPSEPNKPMRKTLSLSLDPNTPTPKPQTPNPKP